MKKFELLRYLKKFSILIFLVALLGSVGIYWYADNNQKYTAYAIIRFTDENITQGLNPDGTKFDAGEIYSSPVISQAMENLGVSGPLNIIRAAVLNGYLLRGMREGKWNRIVFAPTGALLSPTSTMQGESIPGVCHAVILENIGEES